MKKIVFTGFFVLIFFLSACSAGDMMGNNETSIYTSLSFDKDEMRYTASDENDLFYDMGKPSFDYGLLLERNDIEPSPDEQEAIKKTLTLLNNLSEETNLTMGDIMAMSSSALNDTLGETDLNFTLVDIVTFNTIKTLNETIFSQESPTLLISKIEYYEQRTNHTLTDEDIDALNTLQDVMNRMAARDIDIDLGSVDGESLKEAIGTESMYGGSPSSEPEPSESTLEMGFALLDELDDSEE